MGSIPGLGRFPGGGHVNPLQCSCLENSLSPRVSSNSCLLKSVMPSNHLILCHPLLLPSATREAHTQLLTPRALEPMLHKGSPHAAQPEKACTAQQRPSTAKLKERGWTQVQACPALPSKTSHLNQSIRNYQRKVKVCSYVPPFSAPRG